MCPNLKACRQQRYSCVCRICFLPLLHDAHVDIRCAICKQANYFIRNKNLWPADDGANSSSVDLAVLPHKA